MTCIPVAEEAGVKLGLYPDHVPTMAGEDDSNPGYTAGRLFAIGYVRGLWDPLE